MAEYTKNIRVNVILTKDAVKTRTSTTLNFALCDFYFGNVMNKNKQLTLMQKGMDKYREWLIDAVQEWVKKQHNQTQQNLEFLLLEKIYEEGYNSGIGTDRQTKLL